MLVNARPRRRCADDRLVVPDRIAGEPRPMRAGELFSGTVVSTSRSSRRGVRMAITTSSSGGALPRPLPSPLMAHSTWRAGAHAGQRVATASPKVVADRVDMTKSPCTRRDIGDGRANFLGTPHHGVRDVEGATCLASIRSRARVSTREAEMSGCYLPGLELTSSSVAARTGTWQDPGRHSILTAVCSFFFRMVAVQKTRRIFSCPWLPPMLCQHLQLKEKAPSSFVGASAYS